MIKQEWQGKVIDKDLLIQGNKVYGPDTCIFITQSLNKFTLDAASNRGDQPVGVSFAKDRQKYHARCCNPFTGKTENLGYFSDPMTAHQAWKSRKHEISCKLAEQQSCMRLAKSLRERYSTGVSA